MSRAKLKVPANLTHEIYAELDAEWQRAKRRYERQMGSQLPCGPGCADCCKASVLETPFVSFPMGRLEADVLRQALVALPLSVRMSLVGRALDNYSATCLLLSLDDICLVYEARPLWCRIFGLPGVMGCDRIPAIRGLWVERWKQAVDRAWRELRSADDDLVPLHQLVGELAYVK